MKNKLYFNGNIITVDENESIKEAVLVENGLIKAVGSNEEILALKDDNTEVEIRESIDYGNEDLTPMIEGDPTMGRYDEDMESHGYKMGNFEDGEDDVNALYGADSEVEGE